MIWLSWRQQRTETFFAIAVIGLIAALFVPAGLHVASLYAQQHVAACVNSQTSACEQTLGHFGALAGPLRNVLSWLNLLIGLIGVALAAPIILDLENDTAAFAWTQGVTRTRWLASRLGVAVLTALVTGGAFSLLLGWYRSPLDSAFGRFSDGAFDVEGVVPLAYVLFALGLGLAVGVVWRRTAPALVVAFLAYFVARISVDTWLRQHFATPLTATWGPRSNGPDLNQAWVLSEGPSNRAGRPFTGTFQAIQHCVKRGGGPIKSVDHGCLVQHGAAFSHAVYEPASRFWDFQGIETALFAGVGLLLIAFAAWRVLASD